MFLVAGDGVQFSGVVDGVVVVVVVDVVVVVVDGAAHADDDEYSASVDIVIEMKKQSGYLSNRCISNRAY